MIPPLDLSAPPPVADRRPHAVEHHGRRIEDDYAWLRDPAYPRSEDADVRAHLAAENTYFDAAMAPLRPTVDALFEELKGRVQDDDASVPRKDGDWLYWWSFAPGTQYRRWHRRPIAGGADGADEIVIDENDEARDRDYFALGALAISPDGRSAAWSADIAGAERYTLRVRDLATGLDGPAISAHIHGAVVWSSGSDALCYGELDDNFRVVRIRLHRVGNATGDDPVLYEEPEESGFDVGVARSQDRSRIVLTAANHQTSEVRLLDAADPAAPPVLVSPRRAGRMYAVDVAHDRLWVLTNDDHINFRIATADIARPDAWRTVIAGSDRVYLRGATPFARHLAIEERVDGLDQVRLRGYDGDEHRIALPEASYTVGLGANPEFDTPDIRLRYASMVTPDTVFDYDPDTRTLATRKVRAVPSGYDASLYATERLMVRARDGVEVPVSVVYRRDRPRDGSAPLWLYGYGAYGTAIPPGFSADRLSLLDRGWACAIAHIRGGDDLGHGWYVAGRTTERWTTFRDFVDVARGLIDARLATAGRIAIEGGSAGGELMGVVANTDPALWGAVVADVPFVDVLATMLDATLPLTPGEWPEWGNPIEDAAAFDLIASYSPVDNVTAQAYPPMLVTGGLHDPRVTYWEPAKWVARLRAAKTDASPLLLKINMGAGHGGRSGRYEALREKAEAYAFMLAVTGR